jgi:hypothetical protein
MPQISAHLSLHKYLHKYLHTNIYTHQIINDLLKVHRDLRILEVRVRVRAVNELGQLLETHLRRAFAEDKEHRVNHVRLARAVRADHGGESLGCECVGHVGMGHEFRKRQVEIHEAHKHKKTVGSGR